MCPADSKAFDERPGPRRGCATYTAPVSETPEKTEPARPSLRKQPSEPTASAKSTESAVPAKQTKSAKAGKGSTDQPARLPTPRTVDWACIALAVTAVATIARALTLFGSTSMLHDYMVKLNNGAGSKKKTPYTASQIASDIHSYRQGGLLMGVVLAAALAMLIFAFRRARTASGSRWVMLVVMVLTSMPLSVVPVTGLPVATNIVGVVVGVASILAIVFVFFPKQSQKYFRDCKEAAMPPELRGQPRPSLFGPRRQRPGLAGPGGRAAAARAAQNAKSTPTRAGSAATENRTTGASKARAKVRSDAEAVSRGADLARSRAKASKSRRTTD